MSIQQKSANKKSSLSRRVIGIHPVIQFFLEKLNVPQMLASYFVQDARLALSFEKSMGVLVHNILTASSPMYEIADWSVRLDEAALGLEQAELRHICDDRIGRSLDQFYNGRHKELFFQLALRAIKVFKLKCASVHQDTTSLTLSGKYENWAAMERAAHGHNKDYRPDLKQLVLGLTISGDGAVPLCHRVYSGNQSDDMLHLENFKRVQKLLQSSDFIYVADSKLATEANLKNIEGYGGKFISIMPRTWGEDKEFGERVRTDKIKWKHLVKRRNGAGEEVSYQMAEGDYQAKGFKLIWLRSESKRALDEHSREQRLERVLGELGSLRLKLNKRDLKERKKIEERVEKILAAHQCQQLVEYEVESDRSYQKSYQGRGRPAKQSQAKLEWEQIYRLNFKLQQGQVEAAAKGDGVFPLITNVEDKDPKEILELYKYQPFLEKRHSQLKSWQRITPVLLKKDTRVVAYIHMHVLALTVSTLIERSIRTEMKRLKIGSLPIYPERHPCKAPTFFDLERLFRNVEKYEVTRGNEVTLFPAELSEVQQKVLRLLGVPLSAYV